MSNEHETFNTSVFFESNGDIQTLLGCIFAFMAESRVFRNNFAIVAEFLIGRLNDILVGI